MIRTGQRIESFFQPREKKVVQKKVKKDGLKKGEVIWLTIALLILSIGGITIYFQGKKVVIPKKEIVIVKQSGDWPKREVYYKQLEKTFYINGIVIPVHEGKNKKIKKIIMDFNIISSNRYIKSFFWDNHNIHLAKNKILSSLAPVRLDFPLRKEDRVMVKEKVKRELNNLVRELKIDGRVEQVYIKSSIAN